MAATRGVLVNVVTGDESHRAFEMLPMLTAIGGAFFSYLAIFTGINAAKEFGGAPAPGGAVAAIPRRGGLLLLPARDRGGPARARHGRVDRGDRRGGTVLRHRAGAARRGC
jgi:hypothetical protein